MDRISVLIRPRGFSSNVIPLPDCNGVEVRSLKGVHTGGIYFFDAVLPVDVNQSELYDTHLRHLVQESLDNHVSLSVLAYGQTGTGKSYTMGTHPNLNDESKGIMPRVFEQLFQGPTSFYDVRASFYEIYNEQVFDLLVSRRVPLVLKEDQNQHINIPYLTSIPVFSNSDANDVFTIGTSARSVASTNQNALSSRSHVIFSLNIKSRQENKEFSINLVDLAGSECVKRTNATGRTLIEGLNINKSLLALGNVVEALCAKKAHIPFRDSILTKILRETLQSSASYTVMIACISHKEEDLTDTANTLRYAHRAKRIKKQSLVFARKYPVQTPRKCGNTSDIDSKSYPFKTPINNTYLNHSRTKWLTSTGYKRNTHRPEELSDSTISGLQDSSLISNVSSLSNNGLSPIVRRLNKELEQTLFTQINPLFKEIKDLQQQLAEKVSSKRKKSRMTSSPIRLSDISGIESSSDDEVTLKEPSTLVKKRRSRSALGDLTNDATMKLSNSFRSHENATSTSILEKELGIHPDSPILFGRTRNGQLDKETLKVGITPNKSINDSENYVQRRRSIRLLKKEMLKNSLICQPSKEFEQESVEPNVDMPSKGRRRSVRLYEKRMKFKQESDKLKVEKPSKGKRRSFRLYEKRMSMSQPSVHPLHIQENWITVSQKNHNNMVLNILNYGNLKVLQGLPAVGPKSAMVILTHRNLNGPLSSLSHLEDVKGLAKSFCKRFFTQNQIVL